MNVGWFHVLLSGVDDSDWDGDDDDWDGDDDDWACGVYFVDDDDAVLVVPRWSFDHHVQVYPEVCNVNVTFLLMEIPI